MELRLPSVREHQNYLDKKKAVELYEFLFQYKNILEMLASEKTSKQIGKELFMHPRVIENRMHKMRKMAGCHSTLGLIVVAMRMKVIE